jgi:hypothetical protein
MLAISLIRVIGSKMMFFFLLFLIFIFILFERLIIEVVRGYRSLLLYLILKYAFRQWCI